MAHRIKPLPQTEPKWYGISDPFTGRYFIKLWTIDLDAEPQIVNVGGITQYWLGEDAARQEVEWYRTQTGVLRAEYAPEPFNPPPPPPPPYRRAESLTHAQMIAQEIAQETGRKIEYWVRTHTGVPRYIVVETGYEPKGWRHAGTIYPESLIDQIAAGPETPIQPDPASPTPAPLVISRPKPTPIVSLPPPPPSREDDARLRYLQSVVEVANMLQIPYLISVVTLTTGTWYRVSRPGWGGAQNDWPTLSDAHTDAAWCNTLL